MAEWQIETVAGSTRVEGETLVNVPDSDNVALADKDGETVFLVQRHALHYIKKIPSTTGQTIGPGGGVIVSAVGISDPAATARAIARRS